MTFAFVHCVILMQYVTSTDSTEQGQKEQEEGENSKGTEETFDRKKRRLNGNTCTADKECCREKSC